MKLTTRTTHAFIEIKVDEIKTTVFKSSPQEIQSMIENLLDVVDDLASYTDKSVKDYVEEGWHILKPFTTVNTEGYSAEDRE